MMIRGRKGFTLIELLVVIAIIAILAAMLFPVFARARESARKIQCLSNVKNLATAMQMYLTDYDKFPPHNTDPVSTETLIQLSLYGAAPCQGQLDNMNPWMRWPVILDSYIGNRDIWACPSAKVQSLIGVVIPSGFPGGYVGWWQQQIGSPLFYPCNAVWPSGWGGVITDSYAQWDLGYEGGPNMFHQEIGANLYAMGLSLGRIDDPSWYVTFGDAGIWATLGLGFLYLAIPDVCWYTYVMCYPDGPWWYDCVADAIAFSSDIYDSIGASYDMKHPDFTGALIKKGGRHLSGSNIGFADGHAAWMAARQIFAEGPRYSMGGWGGSIVYGKLKGLLPSGPTYAAGDPAAGIAEGSLPPGCVAGSDPTLIY